MVVRIDAEFIAIYVSRSPARARFLDPRPSDEGKDRARIQEMNCFKKPPSLNSLSTHFVNMFDDERKPHGLERDEARRLRRNQSNAEYALWGELRAHKFSGLKFRRQQPSGPYIVDFCCIDRQLIIELDGSQHLDSGEYDDRRTGFLNRHGFRVVWFWNHEVLLGMEDVLAG
jgi:very-short-patch-repair endonuclease